MSYDSILGFHLNAATCGVAKFNQELATRWKIPVRHVFDRGAALSMSPLISIKLSECDDDHQLYDFAERRRVHKTGALLLHDTPAADQEMLAGLLCDAVETVYAANREVAEAINGRPVWCPSPIGTTPVGGLRFHNDAGLKMLMFGMMGKIHPEPYQRLKAALDKLGPYQIWCSAAVHEGTAHDPQTSRGLLALEALFGDRARFVGMLSDAALAGLLRQADGCAAFFAKGVRENNTSVHAAMSLGCPVITNLDPYSPFAHLREVYDVDHFGGFHQRDSIKERAHCWAEAHSWDALLVELTRTNSLCVN